jgi:hypothetical protein
VCIIPSDCSLCAGVAIIATFMLTVMAAAMLLYVQNNLLIAGRYRPAVPT